MIPSIIVVLDVVSPLLGSLTTSEFITLIGALIAAGLLAGVLAGMLGIGGGGILVPVLYEAFGLVGVDEFIRMHLTLGTSLAVIVPTSLRSFAGHRARNAADLPLLRQMAPFVVLGVVAGAIIAKGASSEALRVIWIVVAIFLGAKLALGRDDWKLGNVIPPVGWVRTFAGILGMLSTLMGIGGGILMVTFMTLYNRPLLQSVATSSGLGPLISIPGVIGFIWAGWFISGLPPGSLGFVSLIGAAVILPASVLTAPIGVRLAHGVDKRSLEVVYAVFLFVVAGRFLMTLAG